MRTEIEIFKNRLEQIGIKIEFTANYPWIYIDTINGKKITETFQGEHGFTIAFMPIRANQKLAFTDLKKVFKLIRKYK